MAVFMRFILRMSFRSGRPFMRNSEVDPQYCLMSYGTPDSAVMECIAMVIVIMKNPKSSIYSGGAASQARRGHEENGHSRIQ